MAKKKSKKSSKVFRFRDLPRELRDKIYEYSLIVDDKKRDVNSALYLVNREIGAEAQEWLSRRHIFIHVQITGYEFMLGAFAKLLTGVLMSRGSTESAVTNYKKYNMRVSICDSDTKKRSCPLTDIMLVGEQQIRRFCRMLGSCSTNIATLSPLRSRFTYSFISLPWTTDLDLHLRRERLILACFTHYLFHLQHVSVAGVLDENLGTSVYEALTGERWTNVDHLFTTIDRLEEETISFHNASQHEEAEASALYLADVLEFVQFSFTAKNLPLTKTHAFRNQFTSKKILACYFNARLFIARAGEYYTRACSCVKLSYNARDETLHWRSKMQACAQLALEALLMAVKLGRVTPIPLEIKTEIYYLQWEAYIILGETRKADIALNAAIAYAPEDIMLRGAQGFMETRTFLEMLPPMFSRFKYFLPQGTETPGNEEVVKMLSESVSRLGDSRG